MESNGTPNEAERLELELRKALEEGGHRFTVQRAAVYEVLERTNSHPTADEIFGVVRERIGDISLATVYKALEAFVSSGLAIKLSLGDGPARYDSRTDSHDHVRCISCGRVQDVEDSGLAAWLSSVGDQTDFRLVGYRLELIGTCPDCAH